MKIFGFNEYEIIERPFRRIPINIDYTAEVRISRNNIEYIIKGIPLADAKIEYELKEKSLEETIAKFNLYIVGKIFVERFLGWKMISAQDQLMESLNKEFKRIE